jgi:hypothetical protein
MINLGNLHDVLALFVKDDTIFNSLQNDFTEILADLVSYKNNPNCSCKGRVNKFFADKLQENPQILNKYITNPPFLQNELDKLSLTRQQNNYSGKIITIPKTEQAWQQLALEINRGKLFRSFNVVERDNEIVVYFL